MRKIIQYKAINPGDGQDINFEEKLEDIKFNIYKFNNRKKPKSDKILIISSFCEFGCETVAVQYCIPRVLRENIGKYTIVAGWYGREYFYRHLVDEFWEIDESHQWLREYCRAFHHASINLKELEKKLEYYGKTISSKKLGEYALGNYCRKCGNWWGGTTYEKQCNRCNESDLIRSPFSDIAYWKPLATRLPSPSQEKKNIAASFLKPNSVGVFARGRRCYGRNLQPEFYVNLIKLLREMGYNPVWLGEKQSVQPCPLDDVIDFSRMPSSRDLELTMAIISNLKFTIQYWTASTRLAGMMGIPYILFESPDQIWGNGQEGFRRGLCDFGPSKLAACNFIDIFNDNVLGLNLTRKCIEDVENNNFEDVSLNDKYVQKMKKRFSDKIHG